MIVNVSALYVLLVVFCFSYTRHWYQGIVCTCLAIAVLWCIFYWYNRKGSFAAFPLSSAEQVYHTMRAGDVFFTGDVYNEWDLFGANRGIFHTLLVTEKNGQKRDYFLPVSILIAGVLIILAH